MKLTDLTISQALRGLKDKEFSAVELTQAHLNQMNAHQNLNAYITETPDRALVDAKASDARYAQRNARPLEGIPIAQKDVFCTKDIPTTAASNMLREFIPPYESTVSQKWQDAGTTLLGKANLDEFAMGSTGKTSAFDPAINPHSKDGVHLTPGGSSSGSAVSVAAGLAMGSTGTDTGGSIRLPASFCGIVGVKPTYGRVSRYGCIPLASSLDHPGVFARSVEDSALLLENMAGPDSKDSTCAPNELPKYSDNLNPSIKGLKIGIVREAMLDDLSDDVKKLLNDRIEDLKKEGAEIVEVSMPRLTASLPVYYILCPAEASANLSRYDGVRFGERAKDIQDLTELYMKSRDQGFGEEVRRRILIGTYVLSAGHYDAYFMKAARVRRLITEDYQKAFQRVDALLMPTAGSAAFALDAKMSLLEEYATDIFTVSGNLAGVPGISVPAGFSKEGLPLGLQIQTNLFEEQKMFNIALGLEKISGANKLPSEIL